jgi:hypothetical protein
MVCDVIEMSLVVLCYVYSLYGGKEYRRWCDLELWCKNVSVPVQDQFTSCA